MTALSDTAFQIEAAARLAEAAYRAEAHPRLRRRITHSLDENDVQAYFLDDGTLLIPGSNSLMDYFKFNLRIIRVFGRDYRIADPSVARGASGTLWHHGFLAHAHAVWTWMCVNDLRPRLIVGHSLGAASTQILSKSLGLPGIAFAAPRPRKRRARVTNDRLCLLINRDDDLVCGFPGAFFHVGHVHLCRSRHSTFGRDHDMPHYRRVIAEELEAGRIAPRWPGQALDP